MKKLWKEKQDAAKIINHIKECTKDTKLRENVSIELYQKLQSPITTKLKTKLEKLWKKMEKDVSFPFMYNSQLAIIEPPTGNLINLGDLFDYQAIEGVTEGSPDPFELSGDKAKQNHIQLIY